CDDHKIVSDDHVRHDVTVSSKRGDKGANKLVSECRLSIYEYSWKLHRHGVGIVGQNVVLVGALPRFIILGDEHAHVTDGSKYVRSSHTFPPRSAMLAQFACAMHHQMGPRGRLDCNNRS